MTGWINAADLEATVKGKPWFEDLESVLSSFSPRADRVCVACGSAEYYAKGLCHKCYARMRWAKNRKERPENTELAETILALFAECKSITATARKAGCSRSYAWFVLSKNGYHPRKRADDLKWPEDLVSAASMKLPEGSCESQEAAVMSYLNGLGERGSRAIVMRYKDGKTLVEIGSELGVTRERARQIIRNGLKRLGAQTRMEENRRAARMTDPPELPVITGQIEDLDLSVRAYHCLRRNGIRTIPELMDFIREKPLSSIRCCGEKTEKEILHKIQSFTEEVIRP